MGGSGNDGSHEEGALNGVAGGAADEAAKQDDDSDNSSNSGETGLSDVAKTTSRGLETGEGEEYGGEESIEPDANLIGVADVLEEVAVGEVGQTLANPVVDALGQQSFQPALPVEPTIPVDLLVSVEPITEDTTLPENRTYYDYPIYYEDPYAAFYDDPAYYDYATYYDDPAYYDYAPYYEEQVFVGSDTLDTYYGAAAVTASAQEDGGTGAYAAAGGEAGAYAAVSMG